MSAPILTMLIVFGFLVIGLLILVVLSMRKNNLGTEMEGMHPQGYGIGIGMSIGTGFGVALGIALENLGLGIGIGVAIGAAIGGAWEQRNKNKIRPLTEQEKRGQRLGIIIGIIILLTGVGVFTALLLSRGR
jgi:ABC-type spermidine/putrescine transport system permease subunit II